MKKRHLKELTPEVREEIVRQYEEENILQRNLADKFKVSEQLVGRLVRD